MIGSDIFMIVDDGHEWHPWFAYFPVKIEDKWKWMTTVFRRVIHDPIGGAPAMYQYGTIFDMLGDKHGIDV